MHQRWKRVILIALSPVLVFFLCIEFVKGTFSSHCDFKLSSGDVLRVAERPIYHFEWRGDSWSYKVRILKLSLLGFPTSLIEKKQSVIYRQGCNAVFQQAGQQILIKQAFYSSDDGKSFTSTWDLTRNVFGNQIYPCTYFYLKGNALRVDTWEDCWAMWANPTTSPTSFISSDGGRTWSREPYGRSR